MDEVPVRFSSRINRGPARSHRRARRAATAALAELSRMPPSAGCAWPAVGLMFYSAPAEQALSTGGVGSATCDLRSELRT
jgi:hypothetical protein